jgi:hypothetical protein
MFVVAPRAAEQSDHLRAVAAQNKDQCAALDCEFRARLEIVQARDNFGEIAGAAVFVVIREKARSAVAIVHDFKARGLQFFGEPGRAQRRGGLLAPGGKSRRARGRANQGNLLRLTDDFDRQGLAPYLVFPVYRVTVRMTGTFISQAGNPSGHTLRVSLPGTSNCKVFSGAALARWSPIPAAA